MKIFLIASFAFISLLTSFKTKADLFLKNNCIKLCHSDITGTEKILKSKDYKAKITCSSIAGIETYLDSGYYPRSLYYNIRFSEVLGVSLQEATGGKLVVKLFNEKNNDIPLPKDARFYAAKTFKEGAQINILISIPLKPADTNNKMYSYTFTLKTSSGDKFIDMTGKIRVK